MSIRGFKAKDGTKHQYDYEALANKPSGNGSGGELPDVTAADAGKFLRVSAEGSWVAEELTNVAEVGA